MLLRVVRDVGARRAPLPALSAAMMPLFSLDGRRLLAIGLAMLVGATVVRAQAQAATATVSVSLRVLPQASFEGGPTHGFSALVVPGEALRIDPASGVRTRMTYNAVTKVTVTGTPLRGPGGASVQVRFVCAFGDGLTVSASEPFDCIGGLMADLEHAQTTTIPLAIGAELSAVATLDVPPGLYTGTITLTATHPGY